MQHLAHGKTWLKRQGAKRLSIVNEFLKSLVAELE
jgi:hypothetical protein